MGAKSVKPESVKIAGEVYFEMPKYIYYTGESIEGDICFTAIEELPPSVLEFQFKGKETTSTGKCFSVPVRLARDFYIGEVYACRVPFNLMRWDNPIAPGKYTIPFSYSIQEILPGSFNFTQGRNQARIYYSMHAKLINRNSVIKGKTEIRIINSTKEVPVNIDITENIQIFSWNCQPLGFIGLRFLALKDLYYTDESINFCLEIDNSKGNLMVEGVLHELIVEVTLLNNLLKTKTVKKCVYNHYTNVMLLPRQKCIQDQAVKLTIPLEEIEGILIDLHSVWSSLIQTNFYIKVAAHTEKKFGFHSNFPELSAVVKILPVIHCEPSMPEILEPKFLLDKKSKNDKNDKKLLQDYIKMFENAEDANCESFYTDDSGEIENPKLYRNNNDTDHIANKYWFN
ncbi:hypothetical protein SteCoe_16984 [Stentor coeruleus]|uniref:Arrestin-like N-terminal domain-containing protein n=1 Tax=Stentor coeruleus TaxID=5963 RepID=A0A1R2C065_9CILI|nr:hypothetical protein SteCoe_16984 [Stentor coeruleus]